MIRGLYIHVPFCPSKCPYCDFYSLKYSKDMLERYTNELFRRLKSINESFDTLYFGGGTPSLLGADRVKAIIDNVNLTKNAEITLESNPNIDFSTWKNSGINRLSFGLQSANENELKFLGRKHTLEQAKRSITSARDIGINNISADLMIGIQNMTEKSLDNSIKFCAEMNLEHVSSYILKLEEGTLFYNQNVHTLDEDKTADLYLHMVKTLKDFGYEQYEISNFAKKGYESRHNLKYWNCEEYEALGPSAHSFVDGKRFYYPRDIEFFLSGGEKIFDDYGGDFDEFVMLKLRLVKGINRAECNKFSPEYFDNILKNARKIPKKYIVYDDNSLRLTEEGFLISNTVILELCK